MGKLSARKVTEPEYITPHCIASTSEPNNQVKQISTQQLENKKKTIKNKRKSSSAHVVEVDTQLSNQGTIIAAFQKIKRKLSPEKEADTLRDKNKMSRS